MSTEQELRRQLKTLLVVHNIQLRVSGGRVYAKVRATGSMYGPHWTQGRPWVREELLDHYVDGIDERWLQPLIGHINLHYTE